jgi:hypothetical protein
VDGRFDRKPQDGIAVLIALIALLLFSLLGLYVSLNAATEVRISDNFESLIQAKYAAQAGLNHARTLLRGLDFNDLLKGPDGSYSSSLSYISEARSTAFRNPLSWTKALSLDLDFPADDLGGMPDDGVLSTGSVNGADGTVLIPLTGFSTAGNNPLDSGRAVISRYFAKVSDNNGEARELAGDPVDNPFFDGDGTILVRSMGVAGTIRESVGSEFRRNSVVVIEARYRRRSTLDLAAALVIEGSNVEVTFQGTSLSISGGAGPGIGTIDTDITDGISPDQIILAAAGSGSITGGGSPGPSVVDITGLMRMDPEKALLLEPGYLWNLVTNVVPQAADCVYSGDQSWSGDGAPYLGKFDVEKPTNDPSQDPRIILVDGNLSLSGEVTGGGLLLVRGDFNCGPSFTYAGLILIVGTGRADITGFNRGILGGMLVAKVQSSGGVATFGEPAVSIGGNSTIVANVSAVRMALALLPPSQISYREVTSTMDP